MRCSATHVLFLAVVGTVAPFVSTGFAADEAELLEAAEEQHRQGRYTEAVELASRVIQQDAERLNEILKLDPEVLCKVHSRA